MTTRKVVITTGASGDIGAGLVAGYRRRDWAVVSSSRTIKRSQEPDLVTVAGDITEPATAGRIVDIALVNVSATLTELAEPGTPAVLAALAKGGLAAATRSLAITPCQHQRVHGRDGSAGAGTVEASTALDLGGCHEPGREPRL